MCTSWGCSVLLKPWAQQNPPLERFSLSSQHNSTLDNFRRSGNKALLGEMMFVRRCMDVTNAQLCWQTECWRAATTDWKLCWIYSRSQWCHSLLVFFPSFSDINLRKQKVGTTTVLNVMGIDTHNRTLNWDLTFMACFVAALIVSDS